MESLNGVRGILEVAGRIPGLVGVVKPSPLDSILDLVSVSSRVEDFFDFSLLLIVDGDCGWWWLMVSFDWFGVCCCWFEEADVEDWMEFD